jgi:hypothetical protein
MKYQRSPFVEFAYGDGDTQAARKQEDIWIPHTELASPGHPFYEPLNELLEAEQFDHFVEERTGWRIVGATGQRIGIDATTLEANAAVGSIVRRETGESYEEGDARITKNGRTHLAHNAEHTVDMDKGDGGSSDPCKAPIRATRPPWI